MRRFSVAPPNVVFICMFICLIGLMFSACDSQGGDQATSPKPLATAPLIDAVEAAYQADAGMAVGAAQAPSFVRSHEKLPEPTMVWRWLFDSDFEQQGRVRSQVLYHHEQEDILCKFLPKYQGVLCKPQGLKNNPALATIPWEHIFEDEPFVGTGDMALQGDTLYVVHHSSIASGAQLSAFDVHRGKLLWSERLKALGEVEHSKYRNETQLVVDEDAKVVTVFGKEAAGSYVEQRSMESGTLVAHSRHETYQAHSDVFGHRTEAVQSNHKELKVREDCSDWGIVKTEENTHSTIFNFRDCALLERVEVPHSSYDQASTSLDRVDVLERPGGEAIVVLEYSTGDQESRLVRANYVSAKGVVKAQMYWTLQVQ